MAKITHCTAFITEGEERTAKVLTAELPDTWWIFCNKQLVTPRGRSYEIDFVVLGKHGVYIIEEKGLHGSIQGTSDVWILESGEAIPSPFIQADYAAKITASFLREQIYQLNEIVGKAHFVEAFVLLSIPRDKVITQINDPRIRHRLIYLETAVDQLLAIDRQHSSIDLGPLRDAIKRKLEAFPDRPDIPKRFNRYNIIGRRESSVRFCRTFLAKHEDKPEKSKVLKVFTVKHFLEDEERKEEQKRILRDFEAIRRLSHTGVVPESDPPFEADDGNLLVFPYHLPKGKSLASIIESEAPISLQRALNITLTIIASLETIHEEGILHRNLSPLAIHIVSADPPRAMFSDFDLARISGKDTISIGYEKEEFQSPYLAPELEVGLGFGEPVSDIFAVGIILYEMLSGELSWTDVEHRKLDFEKLKEALVEEPEDILMELRALILELTQEDERERESSIPELRKRISTILERYSSLETKQESKSTCLPWKKGGLVEDQYKVTRKLGGGATSDTFLVHDVLCDQPYVLKCVRDPINVVPTIQTEFKALDGLEHKGIVRIIDVFPPSKPFHIKYEYVEGPTLEELKDEFPWPLDRAARVIREILETLEYLEKQGTYHRDISPKNIILDKIQNQARLVDFGFAKTADDVSKGLVGTPNYWPPEMEKGEPWNPTADLYALMIVLYEMTTGKMPFPKKGDLYRKNELIAPSPELIPPLIWAVIRKALAPEKGKRFGSFAEMLEAFNASLALRVPPETEGKRIINPWVTQLQQLYRNSRKGNQDNRGLDSDFARATYVPTALDEQLLPLILDKRYWIVFLTGNPGDGKTVYLEKIEEKLVALGAHQNRKDPNGWEYVFDNHTFIANYDASESFEGLSSDDVLRDLFKHFEGESIPSVDLHKTILVAVNDGRLRGYFLFEPRYSWLGKEILSQLYKGRAEEQSRILVADLKWRTLIYGAFGHNHSFDSFFEKTLREFIDLINWDVCQECSLRNFCPLKFNADSLKESAEVRTRLKAILELSVLRGRRQMTIRDLRSILSYILVNVDSCESLHEQFEAGKPMLNWLSKLYFNAAFNIENEPDEFLSEFSEYDPAAVPTPRLERHLHYNRGISRRKRTEGLLLQFPTRGKGLLEGLSYQALSKEYYPQSKRRFYFESDNDRLSEDDSALPIWEKLLPYRYLDTFLQVLLGKLTLEDLRSWIAEGITMSDGLFDPDVTTGKLCLKTNDREDQELVVFRQYPVDQFICEIEYPPTYSWLEAVPRHLIFRPISGQPILRIGLDLFELLMRFREGYQPGSQEVESFLIDLSQFKAQMLREQATELALLEASRRVHHIVQRHRTIIRTET